MVLGGPSLYFTGSGFYTYLDSALHTLLSPISSPANLAMQQRMATKVTPYCLQTHLQRHPLKFFHSSKSKTATFSRPDSPTASARMNRESVPSVSSLAESTRGSPVYPRPAQTSSYVE